MGDVQHNYKLPPDVKMKLLTMIARGEKHNVMIQVLKEQHDIAYTSAGLSYLRRQNKDAIVQMQKMILDAEVSDLETVHDAAMRKIARKIDKSNIDEAELEALDEQYRTTDMPLSEYKRKRQGLLNISVNDLVNMTDKLNNQMTKIKGKRSSALIPSGSPADVPNSSETPQLAEALLNAIQKGDTITLKEMIINPNA